MYLGAVFYVHSEVLDCCYELERAESLLHMLVFCKDMLLLEKVHTLDMDETRNVLSPCN